MWLIYNPPPDTNDMLDVKFFSDREDAEREAKELGWTLHPTEVEVEAVDSKGEGSTGEFK
jgi:hypothetical protein